MGRTPQKRSRYQNFDSYTISPILTLFLKCHTRPCFQCRRQQQTCQPGWMSNMRCCQGLYCDQRTRRCYYGGGYQGGNMGGYQGGNMGGYQGGNMGGFRDAPATTDAPASK
ncbi:hypothetical protein BaRGS_00033859 [Batillaria attramentaria]|uniref:Uncharacterized protein n=1 Tax=Batillaria attramentaria TaxID=370345 RepID=A0ABD0JJ09_9CAEN